MVIQITSRLPKGLERKFMIAGNVIKKYPIICVPEGMKGESSYLLRLALTAVLGFLSIIIFVTCHYIPVAKDIRIFIGLVTT